MEGGGAEILAPESDSRRDIEGARVVLLSFRNEATEDAREIIEGVRWVVGLSSVGGGGRVHPNKATRAAVSDGSI